jgi:hypothetical protein
VEEICCQERQRIAGNIVEEQGTDQQLVEQMETGWQTVGRGAEKGIGAVESPLPSASSDA